MSGLYTQFKTDPKKEKEGVSIAYPGEDDDNTPVEKLPTFVVARTGGANTNYQKAQERIFKPHRRAIASNTLSIQRINSLSRQAFVEGSLLGWSNIKDADGKEIPFSKEAALKLFTELPDLYSDLSAQAGDPEHFKADPELDAGNSSSS